MLTQQKLLTLSEYPYTTFNTVWIAIMCKRGHAMVCNIELVKSSFPFIS